MKITAVDAFEVTVPIEAPLRHSYGVHEAFTRTVVLLHTDDGITGLAETAASAASVSRVSQAIIGLDPFEWRVVSARVSQRFYWSKDPLITAAFEMACIDIQGKACDLPAYKILGGKVRDSIAMAAYGFFRHRTDLDGDVSTPATMADHAERLVNEYGFRTFKLKAGVLPPSEEIAVLAAIRERLGAEVALRIDPNAAWTPLTAVGLVDALEEIRLEYLEDPASGIEGMAEVRSRTRLPLATNMCVVEFADLVPAVRRHAVDVVLSDPWYWGGAHATQSLAEMCSVLGISMGMHSGIELGIGMAAMAHIGVTIPSLTAAVDAHYHHLVDDVIEGPMLKPVDGTVTPPEGPGWGVTLDAQKLAKYRELHASGKFGNVYVSANGDGFPDARRPGWFPVMPAW